MKKIDLLQQFCITNQVAIEEQNEDRVCFAYTGKIKKNVKELLERCVRKKCGEKVESVFRLLEKEKWVQLIAEQFKEKKEKKGDGQGDEKKLTMEKDSKASLILGGLIEKGKKCGATDIHIEKDSVRFRIWGSLEKIIRLSDEDYRIVVQKIKMMANLNLVEKRKCQDGKIDYVCDDGQKLFVRVSCMPSFSSDTVDFSESIVLRLLDPGKQFLDIEKLGFNLSQKKIIRSWCDLENGLVLMCGPTGSGKSTTAGALLEEIFLTSSGAKKILSLEDPPEYILPGVTQVKVEAEQNLGFRQIFRSVLRQDPDVIFIGEIRDEETAAVAVQASMTGHLVIATLHTSSIDQTKLRLEELGQKKTYVESVLKGIVLQKLNRGKLDAKLWSA